MNNFKSRGKNNRTRAVYILIEALIFIAIIGIGLLVRLEDYHDWKAQPNRAFYKGEPLLTTFDGYYYLSLARDLVEGTYTPIDMKRAVPDGMPRPEPPPLLSVTAAAIARATHMSLNWIGVFMPAILGVLLAVPLYALGRFYGGPVMGLVAALFGLLSNYYVYRSSLGWFDTDCMNVTWATAAVYCFLKFGLEESKKRYVYFGAGVVVSALFVWWWNTASDIAAIICLVPLAVSLLFFYRPTRREGLIFIGIISVLFVGLLFWKGIDFPVHVFQDVTHKYKSVAKEDTGDFPSIGVTISEQERPHFNTIVVKTTDSLPAFIVGILGLGLLFLKKTKESLFLSVAVALGALSFFFAIRFLIFMAPVIALGIGFFASEVWRITSRFRPILVASMVLVLALAYPSYKEDMAKTFWPKEPPHLVNGMAIASKVTPRNAVIWAWWDHGYPMIYWARRAVITDGAVHGGERTVYNGIPMATSDERLAANFMQFYVKRGISGIHKFYDAVGGDRGRGLDLIKKILSAGPVRARDILRNAGLRGTGGTQDVNQWLEFFFPKKTRPVYLFLDWRLTITAYWWFWLGSWDVEMHKGFHPMYQAFYDIRVQGNRLWGSRGLVIDLDNGILTMGDGDRMPIKEFLVSTFHRIERRIYKRDKGIRFEYFVPAHFGALMDQTMADSVFNKLFLRHQANRKYFIPVVLNSPSHQIWEVRGESFNVGDQGRNQEIVKTEQGN